MEAKVIHGTEGDDLLRGSWWPRDEVFFGYGGNDEIYGYGGNDTLYGGTGDDYLDGGRDDDVLYGEKDRDVLIGGRGHDYLSGGEDDDILDGGRGRDTLEGGSGNDLFTFSGHHSGKDVILDFERGQDKIELVDSRYASVDELLSHITYQQPAEPQPESRETVASTESALIDLGNGNTITVLGINADNPLTAEDFILV